MKLLQGILCAHDAIAQKDYYPHLPEVPPDSDDNEETVKIVQLVKSDEPLVNVVSYVYIFLDFFFDSQFFLKL